MDVEADVYVLDSFAMLAYLQGEAGMERVKGVLKIAEQGDCRVYLSLINLGEVAYITERERGMTEAQAVLAIVEQLPLEVMAVSREAVLQAAHIKANYPLSYADAFAEAAVQNLGGTVLTGDPQFHAVEEIVAVEWLMEVN